MADTAVSQSIQSNHNELAKAKKTYVRVITDKRREQNRRAQKNYREKLKRKLENLEEQVSSATTGKDEKAGDTSSSSSPDEPKTPEGAYSRHSVIDFDSILSAGGDLSIPTVPIDLDFQFHSPLKSSQSLGPNSGTSTYLDDIPEGTDPLSLWQMPHRPAGAAYSPPSNASASYMSGSLTTISPSYAYERQKALIRRQMDSARATPSQRPDSSGFASPQLNLLRLTSESNLSALLAIGLTLNISSTAYLEDHPSHFPRCTRRFFPGATLSALAQRDGPGVPQEFKDHLAMLKKPLQPSAVQMLYNHPSYLDCIIFPRFRERAVQASVDGTLDHVEFFLDLMHGGLVCWGSAMPRLTKRKKRRGMYDQVAWSTRSWEARRWFLEKWAWLCGSEEDEEREGDDDGIWRNSRWWWAVRGELESDEEWSEEEDFETGSGEEARKMKRFAVGVRDESPKPYGERVWAEGRREVKGCEEGASGFDVSSIKYSAPSSEFSEL